MKREQGRVGVKKCGIDFEKAGNTIAPGDDETKSWGPVIVKKSLRFLRCIFLPLEGTGVGLVGLRPKFESSAWVGSSLGFRALSKFHLLILSRLPGATSWVAGGPQH